MYQRKRIELLSTLHSSLSPLFLGQLKNLHKTVAAQFAKDLANGLKQPGYDFAEVVQRGSRVARESFLESAKGDLGRTIGRSLRYAQRSGLRKRTGITRTSSRCWRTICD